MAGGSVSAALKPPRRLEGVFNGASVALGQVGDDHHVLGVPGRDAEGPGELPHQLVAVIEVGADHQMGLIELAGDQTAVVTPLGQSAGHRAAHARQRPGQPVYLADLQHRGLPCTPALTIPGTIRAAKGTLARRLYVPPAGVYLLVT